MFDPISKANINYLALVWLATPKYNKWRMGQELGRDPILGVYNICIYPNKVSFGGESLV